MEVVTQTNAVKSPTDSPATTKLVYTVEEIARMLAISLRSAYNPVSYTHLDVYKRQVPSAPACIMD